ncbi:DUF1553 domain-containing protein [Planctomicrobium piriforme]|nr:PSD1 and planctomycete cytochrome C domain-containing protein [Planctomicrobium piriforme]
MPSSLVRTAWPIAAAFVLLAGAAPLFADDPAALEHFEKQVRPLLVKHCYECHSQQAKRVEANLTLDTREGFLRGGDSGTALVPGAPADSLFIDAVHYGQYEMPPRGKLPDADIAQLEQWVKNGAPWPAEAAPVAHAGPKPFNLQQRRAEHWSWQPVQTVTPPTAKNAAWPKGPIDQFILARLEQESLNPAPPADRSLWLRRVYFDLTGLPPTPAELAADLADTSDSADAHVVDKLLQSPRFGEKWARHWMDLVRYAETHGHEFDYPIHYAHRYRDYLIRALNADVPYDQLLREHVAGDLLANPRLNPGDQTNESVIGTGFWFLGEAVHAPTDVRADLSTRVENQIDVFSRAFLGLSVACARCHDHKFDAISKEDYYALYGVLNSSHREEAWLDPRGEITAAVGSIDELRAAADQSLSSSLSREPLAQSTTLQKTLLACWDVLSLPSATNRSTALARIAAEHQIDPAELSRWVQAFEDEALKACSHPLYACRTLAKGSDQDFSARRAALLVELEQTDKQAQSGRQNATCLSAFETDNWKGWIPTGVAFGSSPLHGTRLDLSSKHAALAIPGTADSGQRSSNLRGSLRSPVFTLAQPRIHTRLRGKNVTLRLVIENYFMDVFQPLLFAQATRKDADTAGNWAWVTQSGDLGNHLGRRAYFEVLDHGDGEVAIDEIWMSDRDAPIDPPSPLSLELAHNASVTSRASLAEACQRNWGDALATAAQGNLTPDSAELINWLLRHQLLETAARIKPLHSGLVQRAKEVPTPIPVLAIAEGHGLDEPVHIRGSDASFGENVPRRFLVAIAGEDQPPVLHGSGRLELADRLTASSNPFRSRVIVNRLWHHLFGRGIVPSVDDFGVMGQPPSHPELLDWLAADFDQHGQSLKHSLRTIVLSQTYRMSSSPQDAAAEERDPENILLHRMPIRRLTAEGIRDAMLAVSGRLDLTMFGPSVPVHITPFMQGRGQPKESGPLDGAGRRSLYQETRRNFLAPLLLTFDQPSPFSCMGRRAVSNVPAQSLILMNDPFVVEQARLWSVRLKAEAPDDAQRLTLAFRQAFARDPTAAEALASEQFLQQQRSATPTGSDDQHWADLCHMLLNKKEFVFLQ